MAKIRTPIPEVTATLMMFEFDRTCCVCREPGKPIQIHNIDEDSSSNEITNLAVLCLHCHEQTQIHGGFGRKLDAAQVLHFRNDWQKRVEERRAAADKIASAKQAGVEIPLQEGNPRRDALPAPEKLANYIRTLPTVRQYAYKQAQPKWDSGNTPTMNQGARDVMDVLEQILFTLASWYPQGHFGGDPRDYINSLRASRYRWHRAHLEPNGPCTGGTMVRTMIVGRVMADLEQMIVEMVSSLSDHLAHFTFTTWKHEWDQIAQLAG